ncbi:substrate-binding periplasmic protein [Psychromonas ossibalaenae]|uniref:substrate-binding periplasmic protein n=1 Tax=Psychromonas ossibalaenae TaxID=444922 RepID=UPI000376A15A|nr:transporter substrate-binding domain-containing protein [Psychromonas ossibalaenae]
MYKSIIVLMFFLFFSFIPISNMKAEEQFHDVLVNVEISEWLPYAYQENGEFKGFAYQIAKDVFARADIAYEFRIKPWARVYDLGLKKKNYMICGVGRTPKREKLFNWVGPVAKNIDIYFYKLKSSPIEINNLEQVRKYVVGVERDAYTHDFMVINGFDKAGYHHVSKTDQLLKMLLAGRFELFLLEEQRVLKEAEKLSLDPELFEKVYFAFNVTDYMAFSKMTSPALADKVRKAYQELHDEGKIRLH